MTNQKDNVNLVPFYIPSQRTPWTPPEALGSGYGVPAAAVLPQEPHANCSETYIDN